jgi:hypothetical protein
MVRTEREMAGVYGPVLLTTYPVPEGFLSRYILCLTPIVLVVISVIVLAFMVDIMHAFLPSLGNSLGIIVPDLPVITDIIVLLISPVGMFLFFMYLGDVLHRTEMWTGAALTLLLSITGALIIVQGMNIPVLSPLYLHILVQWIAYLVQPFSVIAAACVLLGIELFRRSIEYTITRDVVIITGGIWSQAENVIPFHDIERIVVVQSRLGRFFHTGTVVPQGRVFGYRDIDMREHYPTGERVHPKPDHGYTFSWREGAHDPLICLFGVCNPESVKTLLEKAKEQHSEKDQR